MEESLLYSKHPKPPVQNTVSGLREVLVQMQMRVEQMRCDAERLAAQKDALVAAINGLNNSQLLGVVTDSDREELTWFAERISLRAHAVEVTVQIQRDAHQAEALQQVNTFMEQLVMSVQAGDVVAAHKRCLAYISACMSQPTTSADHRFESAVLGCTLDDQKRIRKRLEDLISYLVKSRE